VERRNNFLKARERIVPDTKRARAKIKRERIVIKAEGKINKIKLKKGIFRKQEGSMKLQL
jgi:hypothetical protein